MLVKLREEKIQSIEAKHEQEVKWKEVLQAINNATVFPLSKATTWYMGTNIPCKKAEQLNYLGGIVNYENACREALKDWGAWEVKA